MTPKIATLILAAGNSQRFQGCKQLAQIKGQSLLNRVVEQYQQSTLTDIWVVLGANADAIEQQLPAKVQVIKVDDWQQGMGRSLAKAISQIQQRHYSHIWVGLGDQVALTIADINHYVDILVQHPQQIVATQYPSGAGVPAIFRQIDCPSLIKLHGDKGAKVLLQAQRQQLTLVDCANATVDIDTPEQLQQWLSHNC